MAAAAQIAGSPPADTEPPIAGRYHDVRDPARAQIGQRGSSQRDSIRPTLARPAPRLSRPPRIRSALPRHAERPKGLGTCHQPATGGNDAATGRSPITKVRLSWARPQRCGAIDGMLEQPHLDLTREPPQARAAGRRQVTVEMSVKDVLRIVCGRLQRLIGHAI